ncbi:MAG: transposase [Acidobacteriota bacterium]
MRPLRIEFDGAWYHVMNRGAGRRLVFWSAAHRAMFLQLLGEISTIYGIEVHAYCLMENHYHLLLRTPNAGLGRAMRHLDGVYTQRFNRQVGTDGALFRGRYKSVLVGEDSHLCCVSRYIHLNPLEAKLVARPEEYRASSYRAYLGLESVPAWLLTLETLRKFEPGDARQGYRRFIESGIDAETRAFYAKKRRPPVLGSGEFRERIEERVCATAAGSDPERPDSLLLTERPELEAIAAAVCRSFEISLTDLRPASRRQDGSSAARGAFVLLGREVGGQPLQAIAKWIGYRSHAGASKALGRLRAKTLRKPDIRDRVEAARCDLTKGKQSDSEYQAKT